tara:strand:- start:4681 stop:5706 length:1026 start_codon:yes stop_codon:yes gene_type:complete
MKVDLGNYFFDDTDSIGKGNYSIVYKGYSHQNNQIYAIKKINYQTRYKKYIDDEIELMRLVNHNNIIELYDVLYRHEYIYLILEYCHYGDLHSYIKENICLSESDSLNFFKQIIYGLKHLIDKNIYHRDLKPHNILITIDKKIRICDFGLAKKIDNIDLNTTICGSPMYMAPEIFESNTYDDKSDIWSLGLILFEMLGGYHPFKSSNIEDLKFKIKNVKIPDIKHITKSTKKLLNSLLEKNIEKRISWNKLFNLELLNPIYTQHIQIVENNTQTKIDDIINLHRIKSLPITIPKTIKKSDSFSSDEDFLIVRESNKIHNENYKKPWYNEMYKSIELFINNI